MRSLALPAVGDRLGRAMSGISAIGVKELRGRMRGRRAFVVLTVYLVLLGGFGWMIEGIQEQTYRNTYAGQAAFASAAIGRGIFTALLLLETLLVVVLAPAFTASAISMEREKQTFDMLATTPISSLAIVVGKLFSALVYVFILVLASIPLSALVFVFGGVAPDDVLRGYLVLIAMAIGLGSMGLFFSALARRTQAATILSYIAVLAISLGSIFVFVFWDSVGGRTSFRSDGTTVVSGRPPEALLYFNPYFAQADVLCGVENGFGSFCDQVAYITNRTPFGPGFNPTEPQVKPAPGFGLGGVDDAGVARRLEQEAANLGAIAIEPVAFGMVRDSFWPRSILAWLLISLIFTALSVQLVSPTRRWRPRLPGFLRRRSPRSSA
jgi:ABC-type transport system involved in multi-copper enzyme maturation permease subunit